MHTMARVTVEDCTGKVDNLFDLVLVSSKRARQLAHGREARVELEDDKPTVVALREIAAGLVNRSILEESDEPSEREIFTLPEVDDIEVDLSVDDEDEDDDELEAESGTEEVAGKAADDAEDKPGKA